MRIFGIFDVVDLLAGAPNELVKELLAVLLAFGETFGRGVTMSSLLLVLRLELSEHSGTLDCQEWCSCRTSV